VKSTSIRPFLPVGSTIDWVEVGGSWAAIDVPEGWGRQVMDVLGAQNGPVYNDGRRRLVWILPAEGGADWPDAMAASVIRYGPGDSVFVPGPASRHSAIRWLRSPLGPPEFTDPDALRTAIEFVIGPLEDAAVLGPVEVCLYCAAPTRDGRLVDEVGGVSGPVIPLYACPKCWSNTVKGGEGRHLRAVRRGPR
jgi:hypothetical protein